MIRGFGAETASTYSQTLNREEARVALLNPGIEWKTPSGPFLVSRTGDAG